MFSRLLLKPTHFRFLATSLSTTKKHLQFTHPQNPTSFHSIPKLFSTNGSGRDESNNTIWKLSQENESNFDHLFTEETENLDGIADVDDSSVRSNEIRAKNDGQGNNNDWVSEKELEPWSLVDEKKDFFKIEEGVGEIGESMKVESNDEEVKKLEKEEQELTTILKGPNRAFGDLLAASGITDDMLDSLIALKDLEGVEGLPPLSEIEDMRYERNTKKSSRAEIELQKQEEVAKARVRQVDDKGRAYGTGRRKCSIARVWIQPGDGKFIVNDKQFDVYFPMLDSRAALLRPFTETKTLGLWDVKCTVKGGGTTGQVGAVQLGISRALQNWEPDLRPPLRDSGFLTRDSRVVERKKPGKAKARKSFQWVKR